MSQEAIWDHFQNEGVEAFRHALPRLEFLVRQMSAGDRVLNIGVGSGTLERLAKARGVDIWALDPSERAIAKLRADLHLGEQAQTGYGEQMPFPDNCFDMVVMTEVLEHLAPDIFERTLAETRRVLKPGGRLIGTVPARERLEDSQVVCPQCQHHFHRWGHQSSFGSESMRAALSRQFHVERVEEHFFNEWDSAGWKSRAAGLIKKFLSWRGIGTYGTARNLYFVARVPA